MTTKEKIAYINDNKHNMTNEAMGLKLGLKRTSVQHYVRIYKRENGIELGVRSKNNMEPLTDFGTDGFFDISKWEKCVHV